MPFKDFHDRSRPSSEIVNEVRQRTLATMKGAEVQVEKEEEGPPAGAPINIEISGDVSGRLANDVIKEIGERLKSKLAWDIGGESSQWWGPMVVAVIFGLGFATLLTLIVVPVLCSLAHSLKNRFIVF